MFTGIVEDIGALTALHEGKGKRRKIDCSDSKQYPASCSFRCTFSCSYMDLQLGESIAVDGVCLTVVECGEGWFCVDVSPETYANTHLKHRFAREHEPLEGLGSFYNLERAVRVGDRMGGHWVSGHVDHDSVIAELHSVGEYRELSIMVPSCFQKYLIQKGSITINGVSLTVNSFSEADQCARVMLVPKTMASTTFQYSQEGDSVNVEYDVLAKLVCRQIEKR